MVNKSYSEKVTRRMGRDAPTDKVTVPKSDNPVKVKKLKVSFAPPSGGRAENVRLKQERRKLVKIAREERRLQRRQEKIDVQVLQDT